MKSFKRVGLALALISTLGLTACGKNLTEQALDPNSPDVYATWKAWKDKGALNYNDKYHGVTLEAYSLRRDANGRITNLELVVEPGTSPAKMRSAIAAACGVSESEFEIFPNGVRGAYRVEGQRSCIYEGDTRKMYVFQK